MGIQVQPNCCGQWVAVTPHGMLYNMSIKTGKLTRPRSFGVAHNASNQGGAGCLAKHPTTGKLYLFDHALGGGEQSNLFRLKLDGTASLIGPLKETTPAAGPPVPPEAYDRGISGHCAVFSESEVLYGGSSNGIAARNLTLMTIDISTGTATPKANNYSNIAPTPGTSGPLTHQVFGMGFHPADGLLYGWVLPTSGNWRVGIIDTATGIVGSLATTDLPQGGQPFLTDMKFVKQQNGDYWAYAGGTRLFRCKNIRAASPVIEVIASWSGFQGTAPGSAEYVTGIAHVV